MPEHIEKRLAKNAIRDLPAELDALAVQRSIEAVGRVPAADVAPVVHGRWIDKGSLSCRCSNCGCKSPKEYDFCPHCGAKLDLEKEMEEK